MAFIQNICQRFLNGTCEVWNYGTNVDFIWNYYCSGKVSSWTYVTLHWRGWNSVYRAKCTQITIWPPPKTLSNTENHNIVHKVFNEDIVGNEISEISFCSFNGLVWTPLYILIKLISFRCNWNSRDYSFC